MIKTLNKRGFEEALQTKGKPIVVNFTADWCPYCKQLAPIIEEIALEHTDEIEVYYVDTDDLPDVAEYYDIMAIPTVFVFQDGKVKASAVNPRTKQALSQLIFK